MNRDRKTGHADQEPQRTRPSAERESESVRRRPRAVEDIDRVRPEPRGDVPGAPGRPGEGATADASGKTYEGNTGVAAETAEDEEGAPPGL
jgi:hypothetical protein